MSGILDELPYILRKHTLKEEMPAVEEQSLLFKRVARKKEGFFNNVLAVVTDASIGMKALRMAIDFASEFGCELSLVSPTPFSNEMTSVLKASGVPHIILPKAQNIDREIVFLARKYSFDLLIVPERFSDKIIKMSVATMQILKEAGCSVLVVK